ncbi:MAG TPA: ClbS/DfsB family four-helix bundle protein [Anaerolineae bacterium]|nr:ClbS/DfsB family four-helix bundle protein [Anaerolineae bacterium]
MNAKDPVLSSLRAEFNQWEQFLTTLTDQQITIPPAPSEMSIKDTIAHLRAWQQVSIARLEAAQKNQEPILPDWLSGQNPESDEHREEFNARIYQTYRDQPWSNIHRDWRTGFLHFIELAASIPEPDLLDPQKYPWLNGYNLLAVLEGSSEHHHEHLDQLLPQLT